MAASNDVIATTLRKLLPEMVDAKMRSIEFLNQMKSHGGVELYDGGRRLEIPVNLGDHAATTQFSNGNEEYSLNYADTIQNAVYEWADFGVPIYLNRKDKLDNSGKLALVNLAKARLDIQLERKMREVEARFLQGANATGNPLTDLETLQGDDDSTGWLEGEIAEASQANTVGGLARGTYGADWASPFETASGNFSANGLIAMRGLVTKMQWRNAGMPKFIMASLQSYDLYWNDVEPQERFMKADGVLDANRLGLAFGNATIFPTGYLGYTTTAGSFVYSMIFVAPGHTKLYIHKDANFDLSDFEKKPGTELYIASCYTKMQMGTSLPYSIGLLTNAEA